MKTSYYRTNNFYLSSFLLCRGMELVNIDRTNKKRALFVFIDIPERESIISEYNFGKTANVDARQHALTIKDLKTKLYSYDQ
ncbi:DUF5659 domain-containing protein [Patescibacteria group bacterium]